MRRPYEGQAVSDMQNADQIIMLVVVVVDVEVGWSFVGDLKV